MINIVIDKNTFNKNEIYNLFLNRIVYDMLYNNYRRNENNQ